MTGFRTISVSTPTRRRGVRGPCEGSGPDCRSGFSLIEAMIVLAIAGAALVLAFSAAERGAATGFRLGRRALDQADAGLEQESFRTLVEGFTLGQATGGQATGGQATGPGTLDGPLPFTASPMELRGGAVLARSTACGEEGPVRALRLSLEPGPRGDRLVCQIGGRAPTALMTLAEAGARFSYAVDGGRWQERWIEAESTPLGRPPLRHRVLVRLADPSGRLELVAAIDSGPPASAPPPAPPAGAGEPL